MNTNLTNHLLNSLIIGNSYSSIDIANLISRTPQFVTQRGGVINTTGDNYLILLITLNKKKTATQYADSIQGTTLSWEAPLKQKYAEKRIEDINTQIFIMVRDSPQKNYFYLGRAIPIRVQLFPKGISSRIRFELFELANNHQSDLFIPDIYDQTFKDSVTETYREVAVRTKQFEYRKQALKLWNNKCAVTNIDEPKVLIASHIKPWRESNTLEKIDPKNSLILSPNYDKLFDLGYISFKPTNGKIQLSDKLKADNWDKLKVNPDAELRFVPPNTDNYLKYHNNYIFNFIPSNKSIEDNLID